MFKEKLHKKLFAALEGLHLETPTPLQLQCLSKINAGSDIIAIAPAGAGKTTLITIAAVQKLQRVMDDMPKVLILAGSAEKGQAMAGQIIHVAKHNGLRVNFAFDNDNIDTQSIKIYEGTDILIGSPKRLLDLYFSKSLNISKIKLFVIDDAELIIKNSWQGQTDRLTQSLPKCQHLVFAGEINDKTRALAHKLTVAPHVVELY